MEVPKHKKRIYDSIFKGILKPLINKRKKKENRRKLNDKKKKKQTENNVQRVDGISVRNPQETLP